jgi:hypothetical protein
MVIIRTPTKAWGMHGCDTMINIVYLILGMGNAGYEPLFIARQTESDTNAIVGLFTRIVVLLVAVYLTERYIRKKRRDESD